MKALQACLSALQAIRQSERDYGPALGAGSPVGDILTDEIDAMIDHAIVLAEEELTGQNSDITEAEHSEFAQADWEPWAGGPGEFGYKNTDPRGFHSTFCEVIATKTGAHGWWHVSALGEDDVIACAYLETAAECIQWAADPTAFESNDWPNDTVTTVEP